MRTLGDLFPWRLARADFIEGLRADAEKAAEVATRCRQIAEAAERLAGLERQRAAASGQKVTELARALRSAKAQVLAAGLARANQAKRRRR